MALIGIGNVLLPYHSYALPSISLPEARQLSDLPTILQLTINAKGSVCAIQVLKAPEPDLFPHIERLIQMWTFAPVFKSGAETSTCYRSKLFIYAESRGSRVLWDVPGLTDRMKDK